MNIWIWISIGIIVFFIFLFIIIFKLKEEYGEDTFIGSAVETFKNCCRRIFNG